MDGPNRGKKQGGTEELSPDPRSDYSPGVGTHNGHQYYPESSAVDGGRIQQGGEGQAVDDGRRYYSDVSDAPSQSFGFYPDGSDNSYFINQQGQPELYNPNQSYQSGSEYHPTEMKPEPYDQDQNKQYESARFEPQFSENQDSALYGQDTGPYSQDTGPYSQDTGPYSQQDTGPYSQDTGPYSQDTGPYSQDTGPYSQDTGPYSQDTGPYSQDMIPYTQYDPDKSYLSEQSYEPNESHQYGADEVPYESQMESDNIQRVEALQLSALVPSEEDDLQRKLAEVRLNCLIGGGGGGAGGIGPLNMAGLHF